MQQATTRKIQSQGNTTARPIAHLLHPVMELPVIHVTTQLPTPDTSVNKEVANVAVTGYN